MTHQTTSTTSEHIKVQKHNFKRQIGKDMLKYKGKLLISKDQKLKEGSAEPNRLKSRNNQAVWSKGTEPRVGSDSQHSSSLYIGYKTFHATNFIM